MVYENRTYVTGGIVTTGCKSRLGLSNDQLKMLSETSVEQVVIEIIVVDSIQVMHLADIQSSPGSVGTSA